MATNFWTQFAITGFAGYNFGCMIASDTRFHSRGRFSGSSYPMKTLAEIECLRVVAMATNFETKIAINWVCVNDSDSAIGYVGGLSDRPTECSYCRRR